MLNQLGLNNFHFAIVIKIRQIIFCWLYADFVVHPVIRWLASTFFIILPDCFANVETQGCVLLKLSLGKEANTTSSKGG